MMGWSKETVLKVAKRTGYPVVEAWSSHDQGEMGTVYGPMLHHTGTAKTAKGDYPTLRIVRDGRSDLKNSLCMYGLGRSGTIYCINNKISWHAGAGKWNGVTDGNGHFAGIEAESDGSLNSWTPEQLDAYAKLCASILLETGRDSTWMPRHKDYALPVGRKVDTGGMDYTAIKAKVQGYLNNPNTLLKGSEELTPEESQRLFEVHQQLCGDLRAADLKNGLFGWPTFDGKRRTMVDMLRDWVPGYGRRAEDTQNRVINIQDRVSNSTVVDAERLALSLAANEAFITAISKAVNNDADFRDRDGDPTTGQPDNTVV